MKYFKELEERIRSLVSEKVEFENSLHERSVELATLKDKEKVL